MVNLVIAFEKCNLNSYLDSVGIQDRNIFITEKTSEKIVNSVFRELSLQNKYRPPSIMLSASRFSEVKMFDITDIFYIESFGNLKSINVKNEIFEFYGTLYKIAEVVSRFGFVRVHNSYIISIRHVKEASTRSVRMDDGKVINVGRKYISAYRTAIQRIMVRNLN